MNHGDVSYANDGPTVTQLEKPELVVAYMQVEHVCEDTFEFNREITTSSRITCSVGDRRESVVIVVNGKTGLAVNDSLKIVKA